MYRKPRKGGGSGILNLDSLMDILSCLVGVMLFMVIYTVLELGSTAFQVQMPVDREAPPGSRRLVVVCAGGTVRPLVTDGPLRQLFAGQLVSFAEVPTFVVSANDAPPTDRFFRYSVAYEDQVSAMGERSRTLQLLVDELPGVPGDSAHQLDPSTGYPALLSLLDPAETWIEFAVDGESLEIFRDARQRAVERGFTTGWRPLTGGFPLTYALSAAGSLGEGPDAALSKPQR